MASLKVTILCVFLFGVSSTYAKQPKAIVGADIANNNEFPYQVSLRLRNQHICGGSILDSMHIVTAAHCVKDKDIATMLVVTSTNSVERGGIPREIRRATIHPLYNDSFTASWANDIAIITLKNPINLNRQAKPVKLPTGNYLPGSIAMLSGWGYHEKFRGPLPKRLRKLEMSVISEKECKWRGMGSLYETQVCAFAKKGSGACSGDSGGPLAINGELIGIASFVVPCGRGYPDVFTNVYKFVPWILQTIQDK